jgi:hypothetical protein
MASTDRPEFKKGQPLRAEDLQDLADEVYGPSGPVRTTGGIQARRGARGMQFSFSGEYATTLCKSTSSITASSGTTPGTGTVDFYWLNASNVVEATGQSETVWHMGPLISSGKYCWAQKDQFGEWWAAALECET